MKLLLPLTVEVIIILESETEILTIINLKLINPNLKKAEDVGNMF